MAQSFFRCMATVLAVFFLGIAQPARGEVLIVPAQGNAWDPLVGANPFFVFPGETQSREILINNNPFYQPQLTGPVRLSVACCVDALTRALVAPPLTMGIDTGPCRAGAIARRSGALPPPGAGSSVGGTAEGAVIQLPICSPVPQVEIAPGVGARAAVTAQAAPGAPPGRYIAVVHGSSATSTSTAELFVSIVAPTLPPDGPLPRCAATLVIPVASTSPPPQMAKRANPANNFYTLATTLTNSAPFNGGGLEMRFSNLGVTGPVPLNVATVSFRNTGSWPVGVRTSDSRNCGAPGSMIVVQPGTTRLFNIAAANTTTLIFSKSSCRAAINLFNCWGGSAFGMDDLVALSEGPFWTLFGGRRVDIATVGDWGRLPTPNVVPPGP